MKHRKTIFLFCFTILIIFTFIFSTCTISAKTELVKGAKSAILIDENEGTILYEKNSNVKLAPASMTKVMTLIVIMDAVKEKNIDFNTKITASENAAKMGGSQVYLEAGEAFTLDEMLKCICICSANDCAVSVAEYLYGSESLFVDKMNEKASSLGLINTNFVDCTGLTYENHYTSSHDMAFMAKYLLNNYKDTILKYTSIYDDYIRKDTDDPFWLVNTNKLIGKVDGVDGLKTGWTEKAGYCLTATMIQNKMRLISVVMGYSDAKTRNFETVELLRYGFANFEQKIILPENTIIYTVNNNKLKPEKFNVVIKENVYKIVKKGEETKDVGWEILERPSYITNEPGRINVIYDDKIYKEVLIYNDITVKKKNFISLFVETLVDILL